MSREIKDRIYEPKVPEIPKWGEPYPNILNRESVLVALTDYLLEANFGGYRPDPRKVLAVRDSDKTAMLRVVGTPARREVYYFIEGELFGEGETRLREGQTPQQRAEKLLDGIYEQLYIWVAYDFVNGSPPGFRKPFGNPPVVVGSPNPNPEMVTRNREIKKGINPQFFQPDPVPVFRVPDSFVPDLPTEAVEEYIKHIVENDFRNTLPEWDNPPIFTTPLVGISSAHDPLYRRLQDPEVEGPQLRLPEEWLPGAESVISFFLPYSKDIVGSYKKDSRYSSLESASGKWNGSKFLNVVRRGLIRFAREHGGEGVAPNIDARYDSDVFRPFWSERHAAFAGGLGTFGLHQGLITEKGVFGRIGSVITTLKIPPDVRPYTDVYEYCLYTYDGSCKACITRCPSKAITDAGKIYGVCLNHGNAEHFKDWGYGACHHCSTFVPCSTGIPAKIKKAMAAPDANG